VIGAGTAVLRAGDLAGEENKMIHQVIVISDK